MLGYIEKREICLMKKYVCVSYDGSNQGIEPPSLASIRLSFENTDSLCSYSEHWLVFSKNLHNSRLKSIPGSILRCVRACMLSCFSHAQLIVILWTVACQASVSMGSSRQEYWSGLPCPPPGDLPNSGIELAFLMCPAMAGWFFTSSATWEAHLSNLCSLIL